MENLKAIKETAAATLGASFTFFDLNGGYVTFPEKEPLHRIMSNVKMQCKSSTNREVSELTQITLQYLF